MTDIRALAANPAGVLHEPMTDPLEWAGDPGPVPDNYRDPDDESDDDEEVPAAAPRRLPVLLAGFADRWRGSVSPSELAVLFQVEWSRRGGDDLPKDQLRFLCAEALARSGHFGVEPEAPTYRTLAEIDDAAPAPLILGMLEPTGPTLAYAAPGVGKGTTGSWIIRETQAAGMRPAIYDAETRPREWSRRCAGLGVDRSRVPYITPTDLGSTYAGRPLWESAPVLGKTLQAAGADLLLVDSILPACAVGEDRLRSDAQTPFLFVAALEALGIPSLSFGHTPKGSPEGDPFGSFAWIAAMRLTWIGARAEGEGHRVRWRPRKRNERGHVPGVLLAFDYDADGRLCGVIREDDEESTRDRLLAALIGGPRSAGDLADELLEDDEEPPTPDRRERTLERLKKALQRMRREGWVVKDGTTRNVVWRLVERPR